MKFYLEIFSNKRGCYLEGCDERIHLFLSFRTEILVWCPYGPNEVIPLALDEKWNS